MNSENIQLTSTEILEKDFKTSMRGYNQEEVDEFLDVVIRDYNKFIEQIQRLEAENEQLKRDSDEMRTRQVSQPTHQVNYDILKRLSNLEKEVFGKRS